MFGIPLHDWAWIFMTAGAIAGIWAFQSWRRQKAGKPKHIVGLLALAGVCLGLGIIILTGINVWSWSMPALLVWWVAMCALAGGLYFDVIKSINLSGDGQGSGGHDGHHTLTPILAGGLALMVILTIGHGAINAISSTAHSVKTGPSVADIVHHHHHGGHGKGKG